MKAWLLTVMAGQLMANTHCLQHSHGRQEELFRMAGILPKSKRNATELQKLAWHLYRPCATCKQFVRVGERHDGGYVMCGELLNGTRAAYSYGINGYDGWGAELSSKLGITIQQYDCFDQRQPACPADYNCHFAFHTECLSHRRDDTEDAKALGIKEGSLRTLKEHMMGNGHFEPQTGNSDLVMKMDIEGEEWPVMADPSIKPLLSRFSQIVIEFHWTQMVDNVQVRALQNLLDQFVVVHIHANNCLPSFDMEGYSVPMALEVTYVRKGLVDEGDCVASPAVMDLDHVNNPRGPLPPPIHLP